MGGSVTGLLRRTSLAARISAAPFLVLLLTLALLFLEDQQSRRAQEAIDAIHMRASDTRGRIDDLIATAYLVHSDVSRHLALVDSGTSEAKLADIRRSIDTSLAKSSRLVAELKGSAASDIMADVDARLGNYAKAVANMNEMAQSDRLIAIPLMTHVDKQFGELSKRVLDAQQAILANADAAAQQTRDEAEAASRRFWIGSALVLAAFVAATLAVVRSITGPLAHLTEAMRAISKGQLDTPVEGTEATDEVGSMARALQRFKDGAVEAEALRAAQSRMEKEAEAAKLAALNAMATTVETETRAAVDKVAQRTLLMSGRAEAMQSSAGKVLDKAQTVAAAAHQSLANAQSVASAAEELTASIREIAAQVGHSGGVTRGAVDTAGKAQGTITALSHAVARIGEVATLIADIASQTNLLALNATIEAARAGDAGKGFAVVANEVKNLASQTSKSTEEITRQIAEIRSVTDQTVAAVNDVISAITEIEHISASISEAVDAQGAATGEIARNIVETTHAAQQVSSHIAEVSSEASETGAHAQEVRDTAVDVAGSVEALRQQIVDVVHNSVKAVARRG